MTVRRAERNCDGEPLDNFLQLQDEQTGSMRAGSMRAALLFVAVGQAALDHGRPDSAALLAATLSEQLADRSGQFLINPMLQKVVDYLDGLRQKTETLFTQKFELNTKAVASFVADIGAQEKAVLDQTAASDQADAALADAQSIFDALVAERGEREVSVSSATKELEELEGVRGEEQKVFAESKKGLEKFKDALSTVLVQFEERAGGAVLVGWSYAV